jgi:hypothetical protein
MLVWSLGGGLPTEGFSGLVVDSERNGLVFVDGPADHLAGESLGDDRAVHLALPGGACGDLGDTAGSSPCG